MKELSLNGVNVTNEQRRFPSAPTAIADVSVRWRYANTLAGQEETLGPTHPQTLVTKTHLAGELLKDGENTAALALLDEVRRHLRRAATVRAAGSAEGTTAGSVAYHGVIMRLLFLVLRVSFLIIVMAVAALAQTAPQAPIRQFLLRIEPVRAGFTLQNMTEEEQKTAVAHLAYLKGLFAEGKLALAGQAFDPKGFFGIIVVNAPDLETASRLLHGDPFLKGNLFRGEVIPFRTALERGAPDPLLASAAETGKADLVQALLEVVKPSQRAIDDAYERALQQKRAEMAAVLKKAGAQEPAPAFEADPKVLEGYAGNYRADTVPLTIKVFVRDGNLFMQAAGQSEFPLKARSATQFEFKAAGVEVTFVPDGSFTLKQGPASYVFKKAMYP